MLIPRALSQSASAQSSRRFIHMVLPLMRSQEGSSCGIRVLLSSDDTRNLRHLSRSLWAGTASIWRSSHKDASTKIRQSTNCQKKFEGTSKVYTLQRMEDILTIQVSAAPNTSKHETLPAVLSYLIAPLSRQKSLEDRDPYKLLDKKGRPVLCYRCRGSAASLGADTADLSSKNLSNHSTGLPAGRPVISCDYCDLHWHFDCCDPPVLKMPAPHRKWMCQNHAAHVIVCSMTALESYRADIIRHSHERIASPKLIRSASL